MYTAGKIKPLRLRATSFAKAADVRSATGQPPRHGQVVAYYD